MFQRLVHTMVAVTLAVSLGMATAAPAEAGRGGRIAAGVAAGIIGLGVLGAYAKSRRYRDHDYYEPACYRGPRECRWVRRKCWVDRYGDYVCRRGFRSCRRPLYCD